MLAGLKRSIYVAAKSLGINPTTAMCQIQAFKKARWAAADRDEDREKLMINIGGTRFYKRHWKVLDYVHPKSRHYDFPGIDYNYDLFSGLPLPIEDNSVAIYYSSHTLEHMIESYVPHLMSEMYRTLKPGGIVRLTMPNFDFIYDAWLKEGWHAIMNVSGSTEYDRWRGAVILYGEKEAERILPNWPHEPIVVNGPFTKEQVARRFMEDFAEQYMHIQFEEIDHKIRKMTKDEFANHYTWPTTLEWKESRPQAHSAWYNADKLGRLLSGAGFREVTISKPYESRAPEMRGVGKYWSFDHIRMDTSLYMEAIK